MSHRTDGARPPGGRRSGGRARAGVFVGGGAVLALALASCSSGGQSTATHRSTTTTTTARSTTSTTSGSTTTTTSGSATTTTSAGLATCQAGQLHIAPGQSTGAAGTIAMTMTLTNTSSARCMLEGYPGMQLLDAQGTDIPTTVVRGQARFPWTAANQTPAAVTLTPGSAGTFALEYSDVPVGNETTCPTSTRAEITPPNDYTSVTVTLAIGPCNNGTVHVSPVYAS